MPSKRTTRLYIDDDGTVSARGKAKWFVETWLPDQFDLFADGPVEVEVRRPKRSPGQNRAYWGYVIRPIRQALQEAGYQMTDEALHEHFKERFLGVKSSYSYTDKDTGEVHEATQLRSTTDLDSTEFDRYVEAIRNSEMVRELGLYIPTPGDPDEVFREIEQGEYV